MTTLKATLFATLMGCALSYESMAATITCGGAERTATSTSVELCQTGLGNPGPAELMGDYPATPWTAAGELTGNGTNSYLTVNLLSGTWGDSPIEAEWSIDSSFWDTYNEAVLSMHVGNGNGDPDYFAFLVTPDALAGLLSYADLDDRGGGLSNIRLWGRGESASVPEPGSIGLLSIGTLLLAWSKRRRLARS